MNNYIYWKLFEINYNIQVHPWNANERFCSQIHKIFILFLEDILLKTYKNKKNWYYKIYIQMFKDIEITLKESEWRQPLRLKSRNNLTTIKYIKLLKTLELDIK